MEKPLGEFNVSTMVVVSFPSLVLISSNVLFCTACIKLLQARPVVILLLMVQITIL